MHQNDLLSISAFSKMVEIPRKTLIYYDQIGLFKPAWVADNGYRYYHRSQLDTIGVISIFKELGMSLDEIQAHLGKRTPASTLELLHKQEKLIQLQIAKLERAQQMISKRAGNIEHSLKVNINEMNIIWQNKTPILLSIRMDTNKQQFPEELWKDFQFRLHKENAPIGYPNGVIIPQESLLKKDGDKISYTYCYMETHFHKQAYMPKGYYLVSYSRADYGDTDKIFPQIFDHIEKNNYVIIGDAYEEYLLDEISIQNPNEYLVKVMVHIEDPVNDKNT
ncbi:MerR family transcriptional regulator [Paenibacillus turicensis]|uniref:MerR family transcriptional regulator n=1 Tax=Paenibacillus turicensis TaxID=160487 RepID=UPI003D271F0B